eukprot:895613-Pleurochrysis_carterae.AAC.1
MVAPPSTGPATAESRRPSSRRMGHSLTLCSRRREEPNTGPSGTTVTTLGTPNTLLLETISV